VNRTVTRAREIVALVQAQQLPFLAAAIAYYAFLSVVPLLVVALAVATAVAGETLAAELLEALDQFLTPDAAELLESTLVDAPGRGGVTLLGLAILLWGALRVFRGLDIAFSQVYGTEIQKSFPEQIRDAVLVLVAVALAIGATVAGSVLLSLAPVGLSGLGGSVSLLAVLPVIFFPLYYVFPAENVTVREAVPGAVFAGVSWTLLGTVFGIYASQAGSFQLYGVLGGVLLLLVWFYFAGLVLLVGAVLNAVVAGRLEDRQVQQGGLQRSNQRATMDEDEDDRPAKGRDADGDQGRDKRPDGGHEDDEDHDERSGGSHDERPDGDHDTDGDTGGDADGRGADERDKGSDDSGPSDADARADWSEAADLGARADPATKAELDDLQERIEEFEEEIEDRTVHREDLEGDLKQYVRWRVRRGHARGWGPYLVLLYGTAMTIGAFVFLGGIWAILAMIVVWLSTLGLYTLMVLVGMATGALGIPGRIAERLRKLRDLR